MSGDVVVTLLAFTQQVKPFGERVEDREKHNTATFLIEGISRACTHQLVRHRLGSYSQESQRYVDLKRGGWQPVIPPAIKQNPDMARLIQHTWTAIEIVYRELRASGIRKEDARFLLPNATETEDCCNDEFGSVVSLLLVACQLTKQHNGRFARRHK